MTISRAVLLAFFAASAACKDTRSESDADRRVETGVGGTAAPAAPSTDYIRVEMRPEGAPLPESAVAMALESDVLETLSENEYAIAQGAAAIFAVQSLARVRYKPELLAVTVVNLGPATTLPIRFAATLRSGGEERAYFGAGPTAAPGAPLRLVLVFGVSLDAADSRKIEIGADKASPSETLTTVLF